MSRSPRPWLAATIVGLGCLLVYVRTLYPSVPGGDAGELITAAARLEVAHPPGYPLFTALAHLATLLPWGSLAWRVNLFSAVVDAAAAGVLAATIVTVAQSTIAGIVAAALFAFSPLVWNYAVGAEVFPLNNLLVALLMYGTARFARSGAGRDALAVALTIGLGLAHHHAFLFYAAPVALWLLWTGRPAILAPRRLAMLALAVAAGLAWYLYLPLAGRSATTLSWGDPTTLAGFRDHLLRRDYGTFRLAAGVDPSASSFGERLAAWAAHSAEALLYLGVVLATLGAVTAMRRSAPLRSWAVLWIACATFYVIGFHALANLPVSDPLFRAVTARFWQQSDLVLFMLCGLGLAVLAARPTRVARVAVALGGVALVLAQLAVAVVHHFHRRDDTVARYGRALLEPLLPGTILLTRGDLVTNVTRYLQVGESVRTDVVILDQELLTKPWYVARAAREHPEIVFPGVVYDPADPHGFVMRTFLAANLPTHPVAVYPEWKDGDASVAGVYELWPVGLASRVAPVAIAPALETWRQDSVVALRTLRAYGWRRLDADPPGSWERIAREDVWQAQQRAGWWLLSKAIERDGDPRVLAMARVELERAEHEHPDPPFFLFRNLGLAYERLALRDPALRPKQLAAWRRYLAIAPADDDARSAIAATVARLATEPTPVASSTVTPLASSMVTPVSSSMVTPVASTTATPEPQPSP
ncbi:MAG: DUF2723 domain-containing protein [Candidatus Binatia bacterium]